MGPFEAIVVLIIVGFLMLAAEVFVPGMVLGLLGGLCLSGAVIVAFLYYDAVTGSIVFVGVCVLSVAGFFAWMAAFPHTAIGRRIMLQKSHAKRRRRAGVSLRACWERRDALSHRFAPRARPSSAAGRWTSWRRAILLHLMSRSWWFAKRGCALLFEKRCSRISADA